MTTLYKLDSKGKVRVIRFTVEGNKLIQYSGLKDGKLVKAVKECKGKNIGRSNETTPEQQAVMEMQSRINKKLDAGYVYNVGDAKVPELPMLALNYKDNKNHLIGKEVAIQIKLDGQRAKYNSKDKVLLSRNNIQIDTMSHILEELGSLFETINTVEKYNNIKLDLDGELYNHGLDFQTTMSLLKKQTDSSQSISYHVYDIANPDLTYRERRAILEEIIELKQLEHIKLVDEVRLVLQDEDSIIKEHDKAVENGFEGVMIRDLEDKYKYNARSKGLLKYKSFDDIKLEVLDIVPSEVYTTHGKLVCEVNGERVDCNMKGSHEFREDLLTNKEKYIGQVVEVRFFGFTNKGSLRFPVALGFVLDK